VGWEFGVGRGAGKVGRVFSSWEGPVGQYRSMDESSGFTLG
jgi:hypothetical protein